jgi:pimeloyl-ACP methyl ester carboxylesterase
MAMRPDRQVHTARLATGVRLAYVRHGDPSGVPVLLLHPWSESLGCFDRLVPLLPATAHALAMDQRGHGDADKPAGGYALTDFAADVEAFMDAMVLRSAVLLGSSSGGYVAQQVAIGIPDRVTGLVLVGPPRSLRGRPSFADEVERLTDPVDRAWVERSLAWFPRFTTYRTGTSRTESTTASACPHTRGAKRSPASRRRGPRPRPERSPHPR